MYTSTHSRNNINLKCLGHSSYYIFGIHKKLAGKLRISHCQGKYTIHDTFRCLSCEARILRGISINQVVNEGAYIKQSIRENKGIPQNECYF